MKKCKLLLLAVSMVWGGLCLFLGTNHVMAAEALDKAETVEMEENTYAVSDTAYLNLDWLAGAGNEDAATILKLIGNRTIAVDSSLPDFKRINNMNQTLRRINYDALNLYCLANGYTEIMELGCGYSPRGIYMCERGKNYTGCDFASVVRDMRKLTSYLTPQEKKFLHYKMAGVTSEAEMQQAVQDIKAPMCMVSEGLWMFLGNNVAEALYPGHGDAIMDETMELYDVVSRDDIGKNLFKSPEEAVKFINSCGLQVKRVPLIYGNYEMDPYSCLSDDQEHQLLNVLSEHYLWVITSDSKRPK